MDKVFSYLGKINKSANTKEIIEIADNDSKVLKQKNKELVESWSDKRVAITRLKLLGAENIITVLENIEELEKKLRKNLIFVEKFKIETFNSLKAEKKELINKAREEMAKFYQEIIK